MIKTFRGKLQDGEENKIRLSTKKGKIGYRITSFEIFPEKPGASGVYYEAVVKIFKITQTSIDAEVDFADGNLLAAGMFGADTATHSFYGPMVTIFDEEVFNQDIYITNKDIQADAGMNYMLKLETINLTDNAAAVSTLRDIRLNPAPV